MSEKKTVAGNSAVAKKINEPRKKQIVSGATFWDFNQEPIFTGFFTGRELITVDDEGKPKVAGYYFSTEEDEEVVIGSSFAITKALNEQDTEGVMYREKEGLKFEIISHGQSTLKKTGRKFNKFEVSIWE